jgi:hypothetical protein
MHVTDAPIRERLSRMRPLRERLSRMRPRRRRRPLLILLAVLAVAAAARGIVVLAGSAPAPHTPRTLVLSPFAVGSHEGALITGMNEQLAANEATTGEVIGPGYNPASLASEATGRAAVTLSEPGEYVQFTVKAPANAIDISYALRPGSTAALTVQVDGSTLPVQLPLSSPAPYVAAPGSSGARVRQYFSDVRLLLGRQLEPGDTVQLAETSGTANVPCTIAVADFYQVAAPAAQPPDSVSVVAQGADPTGRHDSSQAFARAIQVADADGRAVWIPPGSFLLGSPLQATRATILGAGSWYSVIRASQFIDNPAAVTGPVNLSGFAIEGFGGRAGTEGAAISGSLGSGSVVNGLWIQGTAGGIALSSGDDYVTVENSEILSTQADGVAVGPGIFGAWVKNNLIRNTAGDGVALSSDSHTTVSNNTVVEPTVGNGIADYGGTDTAIISNVVADTHAAGNGVQIANPPATMPGAQTLLSGMITVADNVVLRCGSGSPQAGAVPFGAVAVDASTHPVSNASINFSSDRIDDSPYSAIEIGARNSTGPKRPVSGMTFDGDSISGAGTVAIQAETGGSATFSDVTGKDIGVAGSFQAARTGSKPAFSVRLGSGNAGWSMTPVRTTYPAPVLGGSHSGTPQPSPTAGSSPGLPLFPSPAAPSPSRGAPAPSAHQSPTPTPTGQPSTAHTSAPPTVHTSAPPTVHTSAPPTAHPSAAPTAPSLSESASSVSLGSTVDIRYSSPTAHDNSWVGIYVPGQPAGKVLPACARVASGTSGLVACGVGSLDGAGSYDVYYGYGYGPRYHRLAGPLALTVSGARSTLSASATSVSQGTNVQISYSTPKANYNNWVGIYPYGQLAGDGEWKAYQFAVNTSGTVTFSTAGLSPGRYYVYLNYNDSYTVLTGPITLTITG